MTAVALYSGMWVPRLWSDGTRRDSEILSSSWISQMRTLRPWEEKQTTHQKRPISLFSEVPPFLEPLLVACLNGDPGLLTAGQCTLHCYFWTQQNPGLLLQVLMGRSSNCGSSDTWSELSGIKWNIYESADFWSHFRLSELNNWEDKIQKASFPGDPDTC